MKRFALLSYLLLFIADSLFSQNVGIGTNSPVTKLHVTGTSGNIATFNGGNQMFITLAENGNNLGYIGSYAGNTEDVDFGTYSGNIGKIHLTTNNIPRLTVINNGNTGIGTVSPQQLLSVAGGMNIDQNDQNAGTIQHMLRFGNFSGEGISSRRTAGSNQYGLDFYTNSLQRMAITNAGNIGIGTLSPGEKLTVNGAINLGHTAIELPGTIRFNNSNNDFEGFDGTQWRSLTANGVFFAPQSDTGYNQQANDNFGYSVKMIDEYLFVGAPNADVNSNANQGTVSVYKKNTFNDTYEWMQLLTAPDGMAGDQFGTSLEATDFGGDPPYYRTYYLLVGSPKKNIGANADEGAAYVFGRDLQSGLFRLMAGAVFSPPDGAANDQFGTSLMIVPDIGNSINFYCSSPAKTVNGNPLQGRVYRCIITPLTSGPDIYYMGQVQLNNSGGLLDAPYALPFGYFGISIASCRCELLNLKITNNTPCHDGEHYIMIGAPGATVNGNNNQGKVFGYADNKNYDTAFTATDGAANDNLGISVSMIDRRVFVGASGKQVSGHALQGKVYVIADSAQSANRVWSQKTTIIAADGQANDRFGYFLRGQNDIVLIGSYSRDNPVTDAGAVYIYQASPGVKNYNYSLRRIVTDPAAQAQSFFGKVFDLLNNKFVIGVPDWDGPGRLNSGKIVFGSIY